VRHDVVVMEEEAIDHATTSRLEDEAIHPAATSTFCAPISSPVLESSAAAEEGLSQVGAQPSPKASFSAEEILGEGAQPGGECSPSVQVKKDGEEGGFKSGLGIRKALRMQWGATVKMWDDGLKDLSDKVKAIKPPTPPVDGSSAHCALPPDSTADAAVLLPVSVPVEEAVQGDGTAADSVAAAPAVVEEHSPWSPVVRPLSQAMENAKSMGVKLADIWDMNDILDDVKQQRDYWRRKREEKRRIAAAAAEATACEEQAAGGGHQDARVPGDGRPGTLVPGDGRPSSAPEAGQEDMGCVATTGAETHRHRPDTSGRPEVLSATPSQIAKEGRGRHRFVGKENSDPDSSDPAAPAVRWTFGERDHTDVPSMGVVERERKGAHDTSEFVA